MQITEIEAILLRGDQAYCASSGAEEAVDNGDWQLIVRVATDEGLVGWADVGGTLAAVRRPNVGQDAVGNGVIRFFGAESGTTMEARDINGEPGIVAYRYGEVVAVIALTLKAGKITRVYVVADPRKLEHVKRALAG